MSQSINRRTAMAVLAGAGAFAVPRIVTSGTGNALDMIRYGNPTPPNKYGMSDPLLPDFPCMRDTSAKKRLLNIDITTIPVFVTLGQSRISNISATGATVYTPTHTTNVININPYDGFLYQLTSPILGTTYVPTVPAENIDWHGRLGDDLITDGWHSATKIAFLPLAIGGAAIDNWDPNGVDPVYASRIAAACALLNDLAIDPIAWLMQIGTTDSIAGTSQSAFAASMRSVIAYQRSFVGRSSDKWFIAKDTINGTSNNVSTAIQAAVDDVVADAGNYAGPDFDAAFTYPTYSDGSHFTDAGNSAAAAAWENSIVAAAI